ncbi:MAG: proline dehydrogenase family protein [Salibacteraceae bacterium]|jgi:proline dehydrogenase|nr:proline dehydrogenase family protein [Salibacteraceae bacterium]MDP4685739.1 proline dehydrogenase family protein [Salibacteraceae bacterium]MDP4762176.1 proline dehydrogenase family protein [Salibacteraceae bacterium]MDP4843780.1 proline dehydrogenase family protein [Salibacteraceae bacterium]MDP4963679.1 proline dehydrogenase family protein [Salibacteraceae bacterium]
MNIDKPETTDFTPLSFRDFSTAFAHLSDKELRFSHRIFSLMNNEKLTSFATSLGELALKWNLPVGWAAKPTIFKVFCGGETIYESLKAVEKLGINNIGAILDYSVEGQEKDHEFGKTELEIVRIIQMASENSSIPVACIKISGIASNLLLEKLSEGKDLNHKDKRDAAALHQRFERICQAAFDNNVPLYVDAEESWLQVAIDRLVESMMVRYNKERAIIFQTIQMFRHDRLSYFSKLIERGRREGFKIGVKIVRGAYLDKENNRAIAKGYPTPIQPNKQATDDAYNAALSLSVENIDWVEICAGTHNEESSIYLTELMHEHNLPNNHPHIYFSQLYGMSDYMSFNLAASGYNVSKYLPYGPVKATLPYLIRRAKENSAIAGQMSKEFTMISNELKRRRQQTFEV